tara:strand:+ start:1622 stop:2209 length:588 start_codon:yes stop_codon:yes gene_type:complete
MKKQQRVQLTLIIIGVILFILTYWYYPNINRFTPSEKKVEKKELEESIETDTTTTFESVEYRGLYDLDKPFTVKSKKAYILKENPNIVFMTNMHVTLYLSDNRIVEITSLKGRYNKANYDCFFEKEVFATDGEIKITADNLDLLATKNFVEIYNDVNLNYPKGFLLADKIDYDFETKHFKVSMYDDKAVKMKVVQ